MKKILSVLILLALIATMAAPVIAAAQDDDGVMSMDGVELELKPMDYDLEGMMPPDNVPGVTSGNRYGHNHNKYAVVIGISDYAAYPGIPPGDEDLWNADKAATEMRLALMTRYGFYRNNIMLLTNEEATAEGILGALTWLAMNANEDSSVVFFYSGHGGTAPDWWGLDWDVEEDGYDEGIISHDWVPIADGVLKAWFSYVQAEKFSMIFDSCYSGGMFDIDYDPYTGLPSEGLAEEGRVIVSACKAEQLTYDVLELDNTLFGYYFVDQAMRRSKAGSNRGWDRVSMEEAWAYAGPLCAGFAAAYGLPPCEPQIYDGYAGELIP